jgi:hypothetical protein
MSELRNNQVVEGAEREARKENVVIFQVEEPDASIKVGHKRKEKDGEKMNELFDEIGAEIDMEEDVRFWFRSGTYKEDQEKPRPIIIGFKDSNRKQEVMNKARNLSKSTVFKEVSIAHDLTKLQREEDLELRNTATRRNADMDDEEQGNFQWRVLGPKGQRRLVKMKVTKDNRKRGRSAEEENESGTQARKSMRSVNS